MVIIFYEHRLPTHKFEQTWDKLVQNLQCYPRFQGPWWITEARLLTKLKLERELVSVDQFEIVRILDAY